MSDDLEGWRDEFPILARTVYMISNSLGAMPRQTARHLAEYAETWETSGVRAWEERWWEMPIEIGNRIARIVGAPAGPVSMHENVTTAHLVALSLVRPSGARRRLRRRRMPQVAVRRTGQRVSVHAARSVEDGAGGIHRLAVACAFVRLRHRRRRGARRCDADDERHTGDSGVLRGARGARHRRGRWGGSHSLAIALSGGAFAETRRAGRPSVGRAARSR